jgi:protein TonB
MTKTLFIILLYLSPIPLVAKDKSNKRELTGLVNVGKGKFERTLNYDFQVKYSQDTCMDMFASKLLDFSIDNDSLFYTAPKISDNRKDLLDFLIHEVWYPRYAQKKGIMGKVYVHFEISEKGIVSNIWVTKSVDISLDKEAVRAIMNMKFDEPALLNNKPIKMCIDIPIGFVLSE